MLVLKFYSYKTDKIPITCSLSIFRRHFRAVIEKIGGVSKTETPPFNVEKFYQLEFKPGAELENSSRTSTGNLSEGITGNIRQLSVGIKVYVIEYVERVGAKLDAH